MRHVLVVANKTLGGDELLRVVRDKASAEPTDFWIVVPATPPPSGRPDAMMEWAKGMPVGPGGTPVPDDHEAAREAAQDRLRVGIERLRQAGATVDGEVGSPDPQHAVRDALAHHEADEIIVSTLPSGVSHWLRLDLPKRLERKYHVPVTTVTALPAHS
jgi:nucleotide-binding universal stress UspA family protein